MKNTSNKKIVYRVLLVVFLIGFVVSVGLMLRDWWLESEAQRKFEQLSSQMTESSQSQTEESQETQTTESETEIETESETEVDILEQLGIVVPEKKLDWEALWKKNEDIYAWIYIPNTKIDYPVLQHPIDDTYYLEHNLDGSKGYPGCIYSESLYNGKDFTDFNTLLYGHNMKNGTMFAALHKFKDSTFFEENRYIYIYLPDKVLVYDVFAAYVTSDRHILAYYSTISDEGKQKYLDDVFAIRDMSAHFRDGVEVTVSSKILTLATCIAGQDSKRYFVQGVLLNGE